MGRKLDSIIWMPISVADSKSSRRCVGQSSGTQSLMRMEGPPGPAIICDQTNSSLEVLNVLLRS
jgi:hypothetical protein